MDKTKSLDVLVRTLAGHESIGASEKLKSCGAINDDCKRIRLQDTNQAKSFTDNISDQSEICAHLKSDILENGVHDVLLVKTVSGLSESCFCKCRNLANESENKKNANCFSCEGEVLHSASVGSKVENEGVCSSSRRGEDHFNGMFRNEIEAHSDLVSNLASDLCRFMRLEDSGRVYILDIDLDFFSTQDPFRMQLSGGQYDLLKELYRFIPPEDNGSIHVMIITYNCSIGYKLIELTIILL